MMHCNKHQWDKRNLYKLSYLFEYDPFGNVTQIIKNSKKPKFLIRYGYNKNNGKLILTTFANGQKEKLEYNARELVSARDYGSGDRVNLDYDSKGRLARVIDENTKLKYLLDYDDAERLTTASVFDANTGKVLRVKDFFKTDKETELALVQMLKDSIEAKKEEI